MKAESSFILNFGKLTYIYSPNRLVYSGVFTIRTARMKSV
jgi:hypothetical protein